MRKLIRTTHNHRIFWIILITLGLIITTGQNNYQIDAGVPDTSSHQENEPAFQFFQEYPEPTTINPTETTSPGSLPKNSGRINLMILIATLAVIVVIVGVWLNRELVNK